mmetsp:Transcript_49997/g.159914  ORF Transcript_49997/g.159914 Transcript_49997/m.159914 type:complete len:498 (+) Transcript_49997:201-1694(+)
MLPGIPCAADADQASCDSVNKGLQRLGILLLLLITLACVHEVLYRLSSILVPFVFSGFVVFAVEPTVEIIYRLLAGLAPPHRWCCCCCTRRQRRHSTRKAAWPQAEAEDVLRSLSDSACVPSAVPASESDTDAEAAEPLLHRDPDSHVFWEGLCRFASVSIMLSAMLLVLLSFITLLVRGALHMQESWATYRVGLQNLLRSLDAAMSAVSGKLNLSPTLSPQIKTLYNYVLSRLQDMVMVLVNTIVSSVSSGVSSFVIVFMYVLFWLLRPLPIGGKASAVVRSYIWKKAFVSLLYGTWVSLLFFALGNDLAIFFGMVSFFLNFVPEVGAIISTLVPVPVILLDGRLDSPLLTLSIATAGQLFLKFAINNVLEVKLIEQDREMSIHPVWVLLGLNYFGYVWGAIGMLISVPLLAMLKSMLLSAMDGSTVLTPDWAGNIISCLEGRPGQRRRPSSRAAVAAPQLVPTPPLPVHACSEGPQQPMLRSRDVPGLLEPKLAT